MSTYSVPDASIYFAADAPTDVRAAFIRRTYGHLAGAIAVFIILETLLLKSPLADFMLSFIQGSRMGWLMILGAFILVGWLARSMATKIESVSMQYVGLGLYVVAEAIIFVPILYIAQNFSAPNVISIAAILTGLLFVGLTAVVFITRKDFSFLSSILTIGGIVALGLIVCGAIFGFNLGLLFSGAMVLLAAGSILYDTSNVLHHYRTDQHVAASLELFASVALLFWYILQIVMSLSRD